MVQRVTVACLLVACGGDDAPPIDVTCRSQLVYLNRAGGTYGPGLRDDATRNVSVLVDSEVVVGPWPKDDTDWRSLVDCITIALSRSRGSRSPRRIRA